MALSKPVCPGVVPDVPVIAQHYLVCDTEDCENNCQFYCNPCHLQLCEQCSDEHQKSSANKNHEVVPYRQRKRKLPVEKCKDHPSKDIDMICENCQVAVCSKFSIRDHRGHTFDDLETIYSKNFTLCLDEIYNVNQYYLPTSQDLKRDIKEDILTLRAFMVKIRASIIAEAESLKRLVEKVMTDNLDQVNELEETLLEKLQSQGKTYDDYKCYLINGDILVGMTTCTYSNGMVARYNKTGNEIQSIERDIIGQGLYSAPHYIKTNINDDICVSDYVKEAVIVVNKSGQHRFSYTGRGLKFLPYGICTDLLGHIIVCETSSQRVHILDQDGQFLSLLVTSQKRIENPHGVCVDDDNNLHVGDGDTNTVIVYKYLQ